MKTTNAILSGLLLAAVSACAQTWTETNTNTEYYWEDIASSADGTKLAATVGQSPGEGIYLSTNSGALWTTSSVPAGAWGVIASSADGTRLVAQNFNGDYYAYTSTNAGATWVQRTTPSADWTSLASSADGSKLIAAQYDGDLLVSTNSGVAWFVPTNLDRYWSSVVCSSDGGKMAAQYSEDDAAPWVSTNCGLTWQPAAMPINQGGNLATTATGNILMLLSRGLFYFSTNWGLTWSSSFGTQIPGYATMVSSADGSTIFTYGGGLGQEEYPATLWVSTNFGVNWTSSGPTNIQWTALASSADGKALVAVSESGGIWVSQTPPSPQLNLSLSNASLNFSWLVPSTNMALQESPDLFNWTTLTNSPSLNDTNLQEQLTLPPANNAGFFRLVSQ